MTETLQQIYDRLGCRGTAAHLGMSTANICGHLRAHGVVVRPRGGDWQRMPNHGKIKRNRAANEADGDPAFRARPCVRLWCDEQARPCVLHGEGHCPACRAEHSLDSICAGASSGWDAHLIGAGR